MCNFDIPHSRYNLTYEQVIERIKEEAAPDVDEICLTGGEPAIRQDIRDIIHWVDKHYPKAKIGLATNARVFYYERYFRMFLPYRKKLMISTELHADNEALHDSITTVDGSFRQAYRGICNLHDNGFRIKLNIVVHKMNYSHIPKLAEFIVREFSGVRKLIMYPIDIYGNAVKNAERVLVKNSKIVKKMEQALRILLDGGIDASIIHTPLCMVSGKYRPYVLAGTTDPGRISFDTKCLACIKKGFCPGMWGSYYERYGGEELTPFREKE